MSLLPVAAWSPEQSAAYIVDAWQQAVASIVETGRRLVEVRDRTGYGGWDDVIALLPFTDRACQMLMKVARHPTIANPKHASHFPASWYTLYQLSRVVDLDERLARGEITPATERSDVQRWLGEQANDRYKARRDLWHTGANMIGDRWEIRHGDFRDLLDDLDPGSVDGIVTDPPYGDESLELWDDLARFAAVALRPGAPLLAWSGQYRLREVLNALAAHLRYGWTICLDLPGTNARFLSSNMIQTWKPIVLFTADTWGPHDWQRDRVVSPTKDQDLFEWQQHPDPRSRSDRPLRRPRRASRRPVRWGRVIRRRRAHRRAQVPRRRTRRRPRRDRSQSPYRSGGRMNQPIPAGLSTIIRHVIAASGLPYRARGNAESVLRGWLTPQLSLFDAVPKQ